MSLKSQKTTTTSIDWDVFKSLVSKLERDGNYKYCLLITIGVFTGLRISDLLQLKYSQFEETNYLTVVEQKTKKTRKIKINPDLKTSVMRLKDLSGVTNSDWPIFMNRYGTKPIDKSWINVNLKKIFKKYLGIREREVMSVYDSLSL
jgi:integrase